MGMRQWDLPLVLSDFEGVARALRNLKGLLGRTPVYVTERLVTSDTTVTDSDDSLLVSTSGGAVTVTLPDASLAYGRRFHVKKMSADANAVTLAPVGGQTIDGAATKSWSVQYASFTIQSVITTTPRVYNWAIV